MTQSQEINPMNYPSITLPYQQAETLGPSQAKGSQPMMCRHIWVYMTAVDLWLITSQPRVGGNTSEEHSQVHDGGKCLCCQGNTWDTA
jgi:hypothetical protein